jgi:hypothetical protein
VESDGLKEVLSEVRRNSVGKVCTTLSGILTCTCGAVQAGTVAADDQKTEKVWTVPGQVLVSDRGNVT